MKKIIIIFAAAMLVFACSGPKKEIEPYVNFLKKQNTSAKDYVLSLFENHDIVILCERLHAELTQYNLILDIIRDQYFIDNVGVVFTEIGIRELNPDLNNFLRNPHLTESEINKQLLHFQRNAGFPMWENTNFSYFLKGIHDINKEIIEKKVKLYPTDIWYMQGQPTAEKFRDLWDTKVKHRDSLMADYIIARFDELKQKNPRQKALVIMNYRHAFKIYNNVGRFLFDKYPDRVANVMINNVGFAEVRSDNDVDFTALQDGKWDAAFRKTNKNNTGFNFKGSPFGKDNFDYFPWFEEELTYSEMFTGFVFYQPIEKFELTVGVPGMMDDGWLEKFFEQFKLFDQVLGREILTDKNELKRYNDTHIFNIFDEDELATMIKSQIQKWLK